MTDTPSTPANALISTQDRCISPMSGFASITTNQTATVKGQEHNFTLADFLIQLRNLKETISPEQLTKIAEIIFTHVNDKSNPHAVKFDQLGISVLQELYKTWKAQGNTGSEGDFLKVIFQYVVIADLATTLQGTSRNQVASVYGLMRLLEQHNTDMTAHKVLFDRLMPGEAMLVDPTYSRFGYLGLAAGATLTKRASTVNKHYPDYISITDQTNEICELNLESLYGHETDLMADVSTPTFLIDYTYGEACQPVFNDVKNWIKGSFTTPYWNDWWSYTNVTEADLNLNTFSDDANIINAGSAGYNVIPMMAFDTANDVSAIQHYITYTLEEPVITKGVTYTLTMHVRNMNVPCVGFMIDGLSDDPEAFIGFNLVTKNTYIHPSIQKDAVKLIFQEVPSKPMWRRVAIIFTAQYTPTVQEKIRIYALDIEDGDLMYKAVEGHAFAISAPSFTNTSVIPPIPVDVDRDDDDPDTVLPPVSVSSPLYTYTHPWNIIYDTNHNPQTFSVFRGTIVVRLVNPFGPTVPNIGTVFEIPYRKNAIIHGTTGTTFIACKIPTTYNGRYQFSLYDYDGALRGYKFVKADMTSDFTTLVLSYNTTSFIAASSNIDEMNNISVSQLSNPTEPATNEIESELVIGSDRFQTPESVINTYIERIVYYPAFASIEQVKSLLGA